ncbi:MAG: hypothetical protein FJZ58_03130 [Chlamydiae bacterium]|nr:hypothetical protein [Chlamydiota bacterium]
MNSPLPKKPIPIGIDDYEELITGGYLHIDKTLLIQEFWDSGSKVILITRPRRFGKSVSLSMVRNFFEKKETSHLFVHTKIWQEERFQVLQGTYPVIHISFKDIKAHRWEKAYEQLTGLLAEEVRRTLLPLENSIPKAYRKNYEALIYETATETKWEESLFFITLILKKVLGKNTIILIDEYDAPITHAYVHGYYDQMIAFMRQLLSKALKGNIHLCRGLMTGVVRTAKDGILSGLNSPQICTMLDWNFSDKFGFTEQEVRALLNETGFLSKYEEITSWYNGYVIGAEYAKNQDTAHLSTSVYNPWSVLSYLESLASPRTYWANTGSTELLEHLIAEASRNIRKDLEILLEKGSLDNKQINQDVILLELNKNNVEPWSFLFFAGYLTAKEHLFSENQHLYTLTIPNREIHELYKKLVINAIGRSYSSQDLTTMLEALITGNATLFANFLEQFVQKFCSSYDVPTDDLERSLHLFVLGLLASLSERYTIKSNLESGKGRYDIAMHPRRSNDLAVVIELKKGHNSNLEPLADEAMRQVQDKNYTAIFRDFGYQGAVLCYGIAAFKKQVAVKLCIEPANK